MSYVLAILELLFDPEHDNRILTNPSLGELKGAIHKWNASPSSHKYESGARYVIHKGDLHFASARHKVHDQIAREVGGEKQPTHYVPIETRYLGGRIENEQLAKFKNTKELHDWARKNWNVYSKGRGSGERFYQSDLGPSNVDKLNRAMAK